MPVSRGAPLRSGSLPPKSGERTKLPPALLSGPIGDRTGLLNPSRKTVECKLSRHGPRFILGNLGERGRHHKGHDLAG